MSSNHKPQSDSLLLEHGNSIFKGHNYGGCTGQCRIVLNTLQLERLTVVLKSRNPTAQRFQKPELRQPGVPTMACLFVCLSVVEFT